MSNSSSQPSAPASPTSSLHLFPSTFSPPFPDSTLTQPPPSSTGGGGVPQGQPGLQSSAQLYLYTFLATLILLLGVSSAIVIRSLLLRRRHRRMVAEAIANGTWIPPAPRVRVDLRRKPRLWQAWLAPPGAGAADSPVEKEGKDKDEWPWDGIMPFAASYLPPAGTPASASALSTLPTSTPPSGLTSATGSAAALAPPSITTTTATTTTTTPAPALEQPRVRVAVLIAMPVPDLFPGLRLDAPAPTPTPTPESDSADGPERDGNDVPPSHPLSETETAPSQPQPQRPTWVPDLPRAWPAPYAAGAGAGADDDDDDVPLPPLEVGLVSVGVVPAPAPEAESSGSRSASEDGGEGK